MFLERFSTRMIALSFCASVLGSGCVKEVVNRVNDLPDQKQIYTIFPKGATLPKGGVADGHYATPSWMITNYPSDTLHFKAKFFSNTYYDMDKDLGGYLQTSKLLGFTDCNAVDPLMHSARFGWLPLEGKMHVLPFVDNYKVHEQDLTTSIAIELERTYEYEIQIINSSYQFSIWDDHGSLLLRQMMDRHCSSTAVKSILSPFFGGPVPAPWKMDIEIEVL